MIVSMLRFLISAFIALFSLLKLFSGQAPSGILFSATSAQTSLPTPSKSINLVDLDGDGDLDLLSETLSGEFFLNSNIEGAFSNAQKLYPQGSTVIKIPNLEDEIGLFHAFDPDDASSNGNYNFEFVSGEGDKSNANFILSTSGELSAGRNLRSGEYSVRVRVTDETGLFLERSFMLSKESDLQGILMTPYFSQSLPAPSSDSLAQDTELGTTNSMFLVDLDKDGDLDLISEDLVGRFFLNHNHMGDFTRDLLLLPNPEISFEANSTLGSPVASILAISPDHLNTQSAISYQLVDGANFPDNQYFTIGSNGTLSLAGTPSPGILKIRVQATNSDGHTLQNNFELEAVEPERFFPSKIELTEVSIKENAPVGTTVGNLIAHDANSEASHIFSLVYPSEDFLVSREGLVTSKKVFDYEFQTSFTITVKATNQYGKSLEQGILIDILDIKEDFDLDGIQDHLDPDDDNDGFTDLQELELGKNPFDHSDFPQFPPNGILISTNTVEENKPIGAMIGYLEASGLNIGLSHNFELLLVPGETLPINIENNGSIFVTGLIDYERDDKISFKVRATNEFGLYLDEDFVIDVMDIDEVMRPISRTLPATVVSATKVELHGELLSDGNSLEVETGFLVGKSLTLSMDEPDTVQLISIKNEAGITFSYSFEAQANEKMYFRSYAANEKGLVLGSIKSFVVGEYSDSVEEQYGIWSGLPDPDNGWFTSDWFGAIKIYPNGWIFHYDLGWLFSSEDKSGVWLWREQNGWLWTGAEIFPFFFNDQNKNWLYYYAGKNGNSYFYDYHNQTLNNTDAKDKNTHSESVGPEPVLFAENGLVVVEKTGGTYRYKNLEGTTTWSVVQNASGEWQIRTGFHENEQTYGIEGAYDQIPEGEYMKHSYEIDDDGVYVYKYHWLETTYITYYKIDSVENGVVKSNFGSSMDQLSQTSYFFTSKEVAENFYNSRQSDQRL